MTKTMTAQDLDKSYTALCNALNTVGETNAQQFLAMLTLSLMARADNAADVLALIENAQNQISRPTIKTPTAPNPQ